MTEAEWSACVDPEKMILHLGDDACPRKLRLFACACMRRVWQLLEDPRSCRAVETAERYADGLATDAELGAAQAVATCAAQYDSRRAIRWAAREVVGDDARFAAFGACRGVLQGHARGRRHAPELLAQAKLFLDIFGNPFRPAPPFAPRWRSPDVLATAGAAYAERSPWGGLDGLTLAALADALEEAGCADEALVGHLRSPGPHVRGCWALDRILSKEGK